MNKLLKQFVLFSFVFSLPIWAQSEAPVENSVAKKDNVLDFSAGVIEGDLNRPSMLMELGSNYKEFNDLVLMREDFNAYHDLDSKFRFRYVDENL